MKRILFVGLGGVGQRHARNVRALLGEEAELIAYRTRRLSHVITPRLDADHSLNVESQYGIKAFDDLGDALGCRPDMAFICNPSSLHISVALQCAKAGCDLFLEKPLASELAGIDDLIEVVREKQRIGMVGYQLRYHPCYLKMLEVLNSGRLGNLLGVRAMVGEYLPNWHPYEDYRIMYASRKELGGGVILSQIHEFDYLYGLFGKPKRLFALGGHWSDLEIDVEDAASILMEFEWGGRGLPVHLHQDYLQAPGRRTCELIGDRATFIADFRAMSASVIGRDGADELFTFNGFDRNEMFLSETRHFLECVESRARPMVDLRDGLASLKMALAAKESIASGTPVNFDDFGGENAPS